MRKTLYTAEDHDYSFAVVVQADVPAYDSIPVKIGVAGGLDEAIEDAMFITPAAALATADALYEAAGRNAPTQLVKASELGVNDALIRVAELHNLKVRFRYAKSDSSPVEVRTFVPKSLKIMEDHTTFVGVDEDRGGFRSFRTDRIKGTVEVVA